MCEDCVPPLTRRWEIRPAGTDLAILTEDNPHGIHVTLTSLTPGVVEFTRSLGPQDSVTYLVYPNLRKNASLRTEMRTSLSGLQLEALCQFARSLLQPLQAHADPVSFFFYGNLRVVVAKVGMHEIEFATTMPVNETITYTPAHAKCLLEHPGTCPMHSQLALLAECIWKAYREPRQPDLRLVG